MNAESAQMVPVSGWIGGRTLGVDGFWQPLAASAESDGECRRFFRHMDAILPWAGSILGTANALRG
jgi:hypothetical protein